MPEWMTAELESKSSKEIVNSAGLPVPVPAALPARTQSALPLGIWVRSAGQQYARAGMRMAEEEADYGRLFLFSPVCLGAGAVIWFLAAADFTAVSLCLCALVPATCAWVAGSGRPIARAVFMALMLLACGMLSAQMESWRRATVVLDSAVTTTLTGRIERREGYGQGRWRYILSVSGTEAPQIRRPPERVSVVARSGGRPFELGEQIMGRARLTPPTGPALPGLNDFSFGAYFDGIGANGFFYGPPQAADASGEPASARSVTEQALEWLYDLRSSIGDRIRSMLPGDTGAFAAALVTDERRAISEGTTEALRQSGLAHIIAISGLNMALSAGIFFVGLRTVLSLFPSIAQAWPVKKIAAAGALTAVTAYFLISGFAVSAERAFIMMAIMLIAVFFDRPSISLRNVALSALAIIMVSPSEVMGPSFQMSFAATLALVAGYALWTERPVRESAFAGLPVPKPIVAAGRFFGGIFLTSLIGGFSTALFSIEHFHRLTAYGLPANLAAMPIISFIIMPFGLVAMLLMPFGLDAPFWAVAGFGLDLVIAIARTVSSWGGDVGIGRLPGWYFPVTVAGFLLLTLLRTRLRHIGTGVMALSTLAVVLLPPKPPPDVVIFEDGGLAAIVEKDALASNRERPPDFIFDQWQRALVLPEHHAPIVLKDIAVPRPEPGQRLQLSFEQQGEARDAMKTAATSGPEGRFSCARKAWCTARLPSGRIFTVIENAAYLGPACDTADIVVTSVRLRFDRCRSDAMLFTGETLRRTGSVELRFEGAATEVTTAFDSLLRPWTRHRAYDWRSDTFKESPVSPLSDNGG